MNREEIEAEAYRRFPIDSTDFEMMQRSDVMWDGFVEGAEWMQEQLAKKQAEVNELSNKVSELTEALDASHVFCGGVKEAMIDKAWNVFFRANGEITYSQFVERMKGE